MKKLTAILLALLITLSLGASAFAANGETRVSVTVDSSQISVTVPTAISIGALVEGGGATVPSNYKITNNSAIPVKVDTIAVALNDTTDWAFKDTAIAAEAAPTTAGVNDIYLTVNGQVLEVQDATAPTVPASWNIAASGELALPLVCSTSRLDQTTAENDLITITYVISAGANS